MSDQHWRDEIDEQEVADAFETMTSVQKLDKDLRAAAKNISAVEARFLVSSYYTAQKVRIRFAQQARAAAAQDEPFETLAWLEKQHRILERQVGIYLDIYSYNHPIGFWMRDIVGIGPVIAAAFLAHVDITRAPTAGHIMAFAGLDPTKKWNKGEKRPWNAELKTVCWKLGESFVKTQNNPKSIYGPLYQEYRAKIDALNAAKHYAEQCEAILAAKNFKKDTIAYAHYSKGVLPDAHVYARAKRWVVKIFISHLHEVWFEWHNGVPAPAPYPHAHLGHAHVIAPPSKHRPTAVPTG